MRIWLKTEKMAAVGVTPAEIRAALQAQNVQAAIGQTKGSYTQVNLNANAGLTNVEDFRRIVVRQNADGVIRLLEMIGRREGVGDLLAEGSLIAAERIGRGTDEFLTTVKGLELAMHDPRHMPVMRASYLLACGLSASIRHAECRQRWQPMLRQWLNQIRHTPFLQQSDLSQSKQVSVENDRVKTKLN